jgi:hypothetical protein
MAPMPSLRSTTTRRGAHALGLGALSCAALAPAAHAANTTLSAEQRATLVAAWAGTIAWSSFDGATGSYRLVVSTGGGAPRPLPVAPSPVPFDVTLGTNRNGSTYAVYTRCATPAPASAPGRARHGLRRLSNEHRHGSRDAAGFDLRSGVGRA